jgi:hypothetical protein
VNSPTATSLLLTTCTAFVDNIVDKPEQVGG